MPDVARRNDAFATATVTTAAARTGRTEDVASPSRALAIAKRARRARPRRGIMHEIRFEQHAFRAEIPTARIGLETFSI